MGNENEKKPPQPRAKDLSTAFCVKAAGICFAISGAFTLASGNLESGIPVTLGGAALYVISKSSLVKPPKT